MNCRQVQAELSRYVDAELRVLVRRKLERHLELCGECRQEAAVIRELGRRAAEAQVSVPPSLEGQIAARLDSARLLSRTRPKEAKHMYLRYGTAAALAGAGIVGWLALSSARADASAALTQVAHTVAHVRSAHISAVMTDVKTAETKRLEIWYREGLIRVQHSGQPPMIFRDGKIYEAVDNKVVVKEGGPPEHITPAHLTFDEFINRHRIAFQKMHGDVWPGEVIDLGTETLRGTSTRVLRMTHADAADFPVRMTWWIEPKLHLPLKAVREAKTGDKWTATGTFEFQFHVPLPDSLFDPQSLLGDK